MTKSIRSLLVFVALIAGGCASQTPQGDGERVASITASPDTTQDTGVVAWEMYRDATSSTVVGVDAAGHRAFVQRTTEAMVDAHKVMTVFISQPVTRSFQVHEDGTRIDFVGSDDARLTTLVTRLGADTEHPDLDQDSEYGPCLSCATNSTGCVASTAACGSCPADGIGCLACAAMVTTCYAAGYYCACCYYGATNC